MAKPKKTKSDSKSFNRTSRGYRDRNSTRGQRGKPRRRFLIVCEGTETEPNYFEALGKKLKDKVNIIIKREGKVSLSLVEKAQEYVEEDGEFGTQDEVWCVFDRDLKKENKNQENFNKAIMLAHNSNIYLAISNDSFELWFLLHFSYYCSQTHRDDLKDMLDSKMKENYNKNDPKLYDKLEPLQQQAIKHAKKLWHSHDEQVDTSIQGIDKLIKKHNINPSTTVYKLVNTLTEYFEH